MLSVQNEMQHRQSGLNNRMRKTIDTSRLKGELREQESMSRHTSWKTGGAADYFYTPADIDDLSVFISENATLAPEALSAMTISLLCFVGYNQSEEKDITKNFVF